MEKKIIEIVDRTIKVKNSSLNTRIVNDPIPLRRSNKSIRRKSGKCILSNSRMIDNVKTTWR